jgi:hypothetical protein
MDIVQARLIQYENEDFDESPQWVDRGTGEPSDFTGSTFEMDIKAAGAEEGAAEASATIGTADIATGIIRIQVADGALAVGTYVYDLVRINGSVRSVLMTGVYEVKQGVSQP